MPLLSQQGFMVNFEVIWNLFFVQTGLPLNCWNVLKYSTE